MSIEEMTKNDLDAVSHILNKSDTFCARCGVRCNPFMFRTCTEWDKAHLCRACHRDGLSYDEDDDHFLMRHKRCLACNTLFSKDDPMDICHDCQVNRCPKHAYRTWRIFVFEYADPDSIMGYDFLTKDAQRRVADEIPDCIECKYWKQLNPKDWARSFDRDYKPIPSNELRTRLKKYLQRYSSDFVFREGYACWRYYERKERDWTFR